MSRRHPERRRSKGEAVTLRYVTGDGCIDMAWPCRVVDDTAEVVALFIAGGSRCKADPKKTAAQKVAAGRTAHPTHDVVWRNDTLRLMFPDARHSVWLFWEGAGAGRRFLRYFVNLEAPFERTPLGFDTQDHTIDILVTPDLECRWRDEAELDNHVALGLYPPELAAAAREEGQRVIEALRDRTHPCLRGWSEWSPEGDWQIPALPPSWTALR